MEINKLPSGKKKLSERNSQETTSNKNGSVERPVKYTSQTKGQISERTKTSVIKGGLSNSKILEKPLRNSYNENPKLNKENSMVSNSNTKKTVVVKKETSMSGIKPGSAVSSGKKVYVSRK